MTVTEIVQSSEIAHAYLSVDLIDVSKTNTRKRFDKQKLAELGESILRHGVLQPILVRPKGERYELVAGERRLRASRELAGLGTIPAIVRELSDKEAVEIQVVENLQRDDLHPLEEAEGYAKLLREFGYDADSLALKIGKSRSYVYGRIKLAELCEPAKKALWDGRISHSVGLLIARIPDAKLQTEALREIAPSRKDSWMGDMSYRQAAEYVHRTFMLRLHDAPWKKDDATLVEEAGPCTTCPFRTGNQKELFGDVQSADICTKPSCYEAKGLAFFRRKAEAAVGAGAEVLSAEESKKVLRNGHVDERSGYVELDHYCWSDPKNRTYRKLVGQALAPVLAFDAERNQVKELVRLRDVKEVLKDKGIDYDRWSASSRGSVNADRRLAERNRLERAIEKALLAEVVAKTAKLAFSAKLYRLFALALARHFMWQMDEVLVGRGHKKPNWRNREKAVTGFIAEQKTDGQLIGVLAEVLFFRWNTQNREKRDLQVEFCKIAGIDAGAVAKKIRAEAAAKKKSSRKAKSPKKTSVKHTKSAKSKGSAA